MRFLISGYGSIGRRHLRNLQTLGMQDIVLHRAGKSTLPVDEIKDFPVRADIREALEEWKPEAVIVSNPTALHLEVAIPAAQMGCALLIEKPLSHSAESLPEFQQALNKGRSQVCIGFQYRFHPTLQLAARFITSGRIGQPYAARVHWGEYLPSWHPWEDYHDSYSARKDLGGGVVNTLCHPFDYLRWMLGEVWEVYGWTASLGNLNVEVEDVASIQLRFESGCQAHIHLDYLQRPKEHTLSILGTGGTIQWDNESGLLKVWTIDSSTRENHKPPAGFERNDMFLQEIQHFIEVARGDQDPICGVQDGIAALNITCAIHESASKNAPVLLPKDRN